jgi:uncharacterized protein (TIGR03435 family)
MREVNIAIGWAGLFLFATNSARGQAAAKLEFEVASVKPISTNNPPSKNGGPGTADPGQITWTGANLNWLLSTAYDVKAYQIRGPDWLRCCSNFYTIVANVPEGATKEQVNLMWQNLLRNRFGVIIHHESRVFQGEELTLPKGPSRLKETAMGRDPVLDRYYTATEWGVLDGTGPRRLLAKALTLQQVASMLDQLAGHPVIDKTGLTGKYDFNVEFESGEPPCASCGIESGLEQEYGLKAVKSTVQLDVIVVDHAEKIPTDN